MIKQTRMLPIRGEGRTTAAMKAAPQLAYYLWYNDRTDYPRQLSRYLDRTDLKIITPRFLDFGGIKLGGISRAIVIDHAFEFTRQHVHEHVHTLIAELIKRNGGGYS